MLSTLLTVALASALPALAGAADAPRPDETVVIVQPLGTRTITVPLSTQIVAPSPRVLRVQGGALGQPPTQITPPGTNSAQPAFPSVWIGVRLSPIPESLAAHVGNAGMMILNVVEGSPADKAGLRQYDIVRDFNGTALEDQSDLSDAIQKNGADHDAKLAIIREGKPQTITIRPANRDSDADIDWKYQEPAQTVDNSMHMFGHTLQLDPNGNWVMRNLGPLQGLPSIDMRSLAPMLQPGLITPDNAAIDTKSAFSMSIVRNGETLSIQRSDGGTITVERTTRDGKKSTTEYDDADALRKGDAEAYEQFERFTQNGGMHVHVYGGDDDDDTIRGLQQDWQAQVEKLLAEQRALADKLRAEADALNDQNAQNAPKAAPDLRARRKDRDDKGARDEKSARTRHEAERVRVKVNAEGAISVTTDSNGKEAHYEFKSKTDFKSRQPELYERVKDLLD